MAETYETPDEAMKAVKEGRGQKRTILETIKAIITYSAKISVGAHGIPLIDRADWNDCLRVDPDFLPAGKQFKMLSFSDGVNAHIMAMDYLRKESEVSSTTTLPIHMVRNGGWCARIDLGQ
jgi:cellobiose phosphorylase